MMVDISVTVRCMAHDRELDATMRNIRGDVVLDVECCSDCTDAAYSEGEQDASAKQEAE